MTTWPAPVHGYDPRADGAECASCPLGPNGFLFTEKWGWAPVPTEHRAVATIALAENPSEMERTKGYPFAGPSGVWWERGINALRKARTSYAIGNVIACQCPGEPTGAYERMTHNVAAMNKRLLAKGEAEGIPASQVPTWKHPAACCRPRLMKDIAPYRNVVTLGGTAVKELLGGASGILSIHGSPMELPSSHGASRKVLPTFHPAFVSRAPQWFRDWVVDLARGERYFADALTWRDPAILWQPTPDQLAAWLAEPTPTARTVSDVETSSTEPLRTTLNCLGMAKRCVEPIHATCFVCGGSGKDPTGAPGPHNDGRCETCLGAGQWVTKTRAVLIPWIARADGLTHAYSQADQRAIFELLAAHWEDPGHWKMGHNFVPFDMLVLREWGFRVLGRRPRIWPVYDTLVPAKLATPDLPKGLAVMGQRYTDVHAWKNDNTGKKIAWNATGPLQLGVYCVARGTHVIMADGTTAPIETLVGAQDTRSVLSLNAAGEIEPRPITGWHRVHIPGQAWLEIRHEALGAKQRGIRCTPEHRVWTRTGWVEAQHVQPGMSLACAQPGPQVTREPSWRIVTRVAPWVTRSDRYCLTVETNHNFFTTAGLVANCTRDCAVNDEAADPLIADAVARGMREPLRDDLKPTTWPAAFSWTLEGVDHRTLFMCTGLHENGMFIDQERRRAHADKLVTEKAVRRAECMAFAERAGLPSTWNPGSPEQVIDLLYDKWRWPVIKRSKQTDLPSTDDACLREHIVDKNLPEDQRKFASAIRLFRRAGKAKSTFVDVIAPETVQIGKEKFGIAWASDGRVHSKWNQLPGVGRLNSSDNNVQNIPKKFRDQYVPAPGHVYVSADMDQLHLRIIANKWRIKALLAGFLEGIDPHCSLAYAFFPKEFPIVDGWGEKGFSLKRKPKKDSDADKIRNQAKVIRYQGAYADIPLGIHRSVTKVENKKGELIYANVSVSQVQAWYDIWMDAEPDWQTAWDMEMSAFRRNGGWIGDGLFGRRSGALEGGKKQAVVNWPILATEPCIMRIAESNVLAAFPFGFAGPGTGMVNQCHDSITLEVPGACWDEPAGRTDQGPEVYWKKLDAERILCWDARAERARRTLEECMNVVVPGWPVPFTCEADVGRSWAEA